MMITLGELFYFAFYPLIKLVQWILFKIAYYAFFSFLSKAREWGQITVKISGEENLKIFGDSKSDKKVTLNILNKNRFFTNCIIKGDIGFAESFMQGDIEVDDLTTLFKIFIANRDAMNGLDTGFAWLGHILDRLSHMRRANTIIGSKKNIQMHYDLGNELFKLFLDPTMTYSCAIFLDSNETLENAQINKLRAMINKADLKKEDHLLEIGSGWGSLAIEAASSIGCKVTTITLSIEQKELAEERIKKRKLQHLIDVQLIDYRDLKGKYDKIISVEMLEAVGHNFLPTYFESCYNLLKPGGKMVFQVITTPNKTYEEYRRGCDFIQKYIFPGSLCPSIGAVLDAIEANSKFVVQQIDNIGWGRILFINFNRYPLR